MLDIILRNGTIIDGTGTGAFNGDVWIRGDKIVFVGKSEEEPPQAREIVDVTGYIVCPGFIDTHTHSDLALLWDRQHAPALMQGITTEILGQDGMSYAPLSKENLLMYSKYLAGSNGHAELSFDWNTVAEFRSKFNRCGINTAYLLPHSSLRLETVGMNDVLLDEEQLSKACAMLGQGLEEGAKGFSTGLSYYPHAYSDTSELIEFCKVAAKYGSVFAIHLRTVFRGEAFDPVCEAIEIAEKSGVKLHFSHYRTNIKTAGKTGFIMEKIDKAMSRGIDISLEIYPYSYGSSLGQMFLPRWTVEGGYYETLERMKEPEVKKRLAMEIDNKWKGFNAYFSYLNKNTSYMGMTFSDVARERNQTLGEMLTDIISEESLCVGFHDIPPEDDEVNRQIEQDALELLKRPNYMVGSDSILMGDNPHPRAFGTFPKFLRLSREYNYPLEQMINRMTKVPSDRFGLSGRGCLEQGNFADIVVFDYHNVADTAVPLRSRSAPIGIEYVLVNGKIAVRDNHVTGILAGYGI